MAGITESLGAQALEGTAGLEPAPPLILPGGVSAGPTATRGLSPLVGSSVFHPWQGRGLSRRCLGRSQGWV